ncbi:Uncharacterised protein [Chlamydia trachomatis]|nr:Uncharacterised protein [Chlamydia trachomatis]
MRPRGVSCSENATLRDCSRPCAMRAAFSRGDSYAGVSWSINMRPVAELKDGSVFCCLRARMSDCETSGAHSALAPYTSLAGNDSSL